jgi:hypothetical protein
LERIFEDGMPFGIVDEGHEVEEQSFTPHTQPFAQAL